MALKKSINLKKALTTSAVILALCLSTLIGITYALFTSDANDGIIGINSTAGIVKVDILNENDKSLVDQSFTFYTPDGKQDILWEPGATYYTEAFKIKNAGNVDMKYQIYINGGVGDTKLLEAFDFYITTDPASKDAIVELDGSFIESLAEKECSEYYYLVAHMKEEAGNEYKKLKLSGVGITVYAVQENANKD